MRARVCIYMDGLMLRGGGGIQAENHPRPLFLANTYSLKSHMHFQVHLPRLHATPLWLPSTVGKINWILSKSKILYMKIHYKKGPV